MNAENMDLTTVSFYRGGFPDNSSGKVVKIDFHSCHQVRKFMDLVSEIAAGRHEIVELSNSLEIHYSPSVRSFSLALKSRQGRENLVTIIEAEQGGVSIKWSATEDAWLDVSAFLEPLAVSTGGHQFLTSGADGAEIVAAHYK